MLIFFLFKTRVFNVPFYYYIIAASDRQEIKFLMNTDACAIEECTSMYYCIDVFTVLHSNRKNKP